MNNETCNFERIRYFTIIVNGHLKNNKNHSIRILSMVKKISSSLDARECSTNVERIHTAEYFKMPDERLKGGNQGAVARFPSFVVEKGIYRRRYSPFHALLPALKFSSPCIRGVSRDSSSFLSSPPCRPPSQARRK